MKLMTPPPPSKWETFRAMDGRVPSLEECDRRYPLPVLPTRRHLRAEKHPTGIVARKEGIIRRCSDDLDPTEGQINAFMNKLTASGDHLMFEAGTKFHVNCRLTDGTTTVVSAARFYWKIRYPREPFLADDRIMNACGLSSKDHAGNGLCMTHLKLEGPARKN